MLQFRIRELVAQREREISRRLPLAEVANATGVSAQVLSSLSNPGKRIVTNTAHLEALCRYFRCGLDELVVMSPPVADESVGCHIDVLYPERRPSSRRDASEES